MAKEVKDPHYCDVCGKVIEWHEAHWLNSGFGVCDECNDIIPENIKEKLYDEGWGFLSPETCKYLDSINANY